MLITPGGIPARLANYRLSSDLDSDRGRLVAYFGQCKAGVGRLGWGLDHGRAPCRKGSTELPSYHRRGEIPRGQDRSEGGSR